MKSKKLLSFLCLVALTGCTFSPSTPSNSQKPSTPASSSTAAPSSPSSSNTGDNSSTAPSSSTNSSTGNSSTTVDSSSTNPSTGNSSTTVDSSSTNPSTGNSSTTVDSSSTNPSTGNSSTTVDSSSTNSSTGNSSTIVDSSSTNSSTGNSSTIVDSSSGNSSTGDSSTPVVSPDTPNVRLANLQEHVLSKVGEELVSYTLAKYNTNSNSKTLTSTVYNTNSVEVKTTNVQGWEETITSKYYTSKDNRFYIIDADVEEYYDWRTEQDVVNYTATTVTGYEIVDEAESYAQVTQDDVDAYYSFASATVNGFGMGTSIDGLIEAAFETFDEENSYNITFGTTYVDNSDFEGSVTSVSYFTEKITPYYSSVYEYSYSFGYDADGYLSYANFIQSTYDEGAYDYETHSLNYGYIPSGTYYYTYSFDFGTRATETTLKYNIDELTFEDYEIKFYSDEECTIESTNFESGTSAYVKVTGTPEEVTTDSVMLYSVSNPEVSNASAGYVVESIRFRGEGESTFTFSSANGIKRSVTVTVTAPAPTEITCYPDFPAVLAVGDIVELPRASIRPYEASQEVRWVIATGTDCAEVYEENDTYYIRALATGTFTFYACAAADETVRTEVFELSVVESKTEEELREILTSNVWACNDGLIYTMTLNAEGKGEINFGYETNYDPELGDVPAEVETTYTFDYVFDYDNVTFTVSNGTWNNRSENGMYSSFTDPVISPSFLGDKVTVAFGWLSLDFVPAYTEDEVKEVYQSTYSGCFFQFEYLELSLEISETHVTFFTEAYINNEDLIKCEASVEYFWNADGKIELVGGDFAYDAYRYYDYENLCDVTVSIVIDSVLDVDVYLAAYLNVTIHVGTTSYTARFTESY